MQEASNRDDVVSQTRPAGEGLAAKRYEPKSFGNLPYSSLLANKILAALPAPDLARLLSHLEPVYFAVNEEPYRYAEIFTHAYFPENAVLAHLHLLADGAMIETALIGRDGLLGLSSLLGEQTTSYLTRVLVAGSALRIKTGILKDEFRRGGALQRLLLSCARERLLQISQKAVCNGRHKIEERFCSWLLMVQDRAGESSLPLTHEQIARHLGARRAGITCVATTLRKRQIIGYSRGLIQILDRAALENGACECYQALNTAARL